MSKVFSVTDGKAVDHTVLLGATLDDQVEITKGLKPGGEVVITGASKLAGGAPVVRGAFGEARRGSGVNPMFALGFWSNRLAASGAREIDPEEMLELKWYRQNWGGTCLSHAAPSDLLASRRWQLRGA